MNIPDGWRLMIAGEVVGQADKYSRPGNNHWSECWASIGSLVTKENEHIYFIRKTNENNVKELQDKIKAQTDALNRSRQQEILLLLEDAKSKGFIVGARLTNGKIISDVIVVNSEHNSELSIGLHLHWEATETAFVAIKYGKSNTQIMSSLEIDARPCVPPLHGYNGVYSKLNNSISYGCAVLDVGLLRNIHNVMMTPVAGGNRKLRSFELDSGKYITCKDVAAILEYVDFMDKEAK